jgi:hypothetical protein
MLHVPKNALENATMSERSFLTSLPARLAQRMDTNVQRIGIEIALIDSKGAVTLAS